MYSPLPCAVATHIREEYLLQEYFTQTLPYNSTFMKVSSLCVCHNYSGRGTVSHCDLARAGLFIPNILLRTLWREGRSESSV